MRYFKDSTGAVKAFEDDVQDNWIEGLEEISEQEAAEASAPTSEQLSADALRRRSVAYADPESGSDRLFAEAVRMREMDEDGWQVARERAIARYEEIREQNPLPSQND